MSRWFLLLQPDYWTKIDVLDADEPAELALLLKEYAAPASFVDGATVGDFIDLEGTRERLLVRLGREWPTS